MGLDTVRVALPISTHEAAQLKGRLCVERETRDTRTGATTLGGTVGEGCPFRFSLTSTRLVLEGSLHKWVHGTNATDMGRSDVGYAIEGLSDTVGLDLAPAEVCRLDIGYNLPVDFEPVTYFPSIKTPARMRRTERGTSLYLENDRRTLILYDKAKELKAKGQPLPAAYALGPVLRAELRYKKRVAQQLKCERLPLGQLSHEPFYVALVARWRRVFRNLPLVPQFRFDDQTPLKGATDAIERLAAWALHNGFPPEALEAMLSGEGVSRKARHDIRAKIKAMAQRPHLIVPDTRREELNRKVLQAAEFCR